MSAHDEDSALGRLTAELDRLGPDFIYVHALELRISFHPGCGCEGPWTVEIVRSPLSRRCVAQGHGLTLDEAATTCGWEAAAIPNWGAPVGAPS